MKKLILIMNIFIIYLYFNHPFTSLAIPKNIAAGDLILREGIGLDSSAIKIAAHSDYTHIGIIIATNPAQILHASYDDFGKSGVYITSLAEFYKGAKKIKIIRLDELANVDIPALLARLKSYIGKPFDLRSDPNALYCSTLIYREIAPLLRQSLKPTKINLPVFGGEYLLPSEFLKLPHRTIYEATDYFKLF